MALKLFESLNWELHCTVGLRRKRHSCRTSIIFRSPVTFWFEESTHPLRPG